MWLEFWKTFVSSAPGFLGLAATAALCIGYRQIHINRAASREATLRALNDTQNRICMEHPKFANPTLAVYDVDAKTFEGSSEQFERYIWFVIIGLVVVERAWKIGFESQWRSSIQHFYRVHDKLLSSAFFQSHWATFDPLHLQYWRDWRAAAQFV